MRHGPTGGQIDAALLRIARKSGAGQALLQVLRSGTEDDAFHAALALPFVDDDLVRHALRREARTAIGMRRALARAALRDDELHRIVGDGVPEEDLVHAAGPLVLNDPRAFVDLLCEGRPDVTLAMVEHVERVATTHGVATATLCALVLERRLTRAARRRVMALLGRDASPDARALLDREQGRAIDDEDRRTLRLEKMRQGSTAIAPVREERRGHAILYPLDATGAARLVVIEHHAPGKSLVSELVVATSGPVRARSRTDDVPEAEPGTATLSLGQARTFIEVLPTARRKAAAPLLARLALVAAEPLAGPAPTTPLDAEESGRLARTTTFAQWRPRVRTSTPTRRIVVGLQHQALVLHLVGDVAAGRVAADALQVARGRKSLLVAALAEREETPTLG